MLLARKDHSDLMPDFFDRFFDPDWVPMVNTTAPAVNVKESEKAYTMDIAVPGLKKDHCSVNVDEEGNLAIRIEAKNESKDEDKKEHYLRREFSYGDYEQSYVLPDDVNKEQISAKVDDGVLEIEMPKFLKAEEKKNCRKIEIA
ncbi:MAG: Hsp20/alpha crystallin family protein [Prevotella sp.]|jgi:HSP20 family protein|nr:MULTISPECIES: Hsp20/alpha crystallin family protein [unclassified Prevotella]MCH3993139.1 Hsp20/alpha crystallin family protein [Prevotella sp.]MCH4018012.1 Hsp20/alpha crystallin family protein [Prevotella sp.]MCH4100793.1 Hsp20/alpha crystallin family protein [Prevotella sp.]MCH4215715.1 Hsp20/alpha crystallin family protein [Prevotella sp.]MCI1291670.1 Hsp20/alpha crystallin family protein [Prevotella sp.]